MGEEKKHTDMHTCINPKHLEAAVNMINGLRRDKRRSPARLVLHGGSQSHRVDRLHTLHGDSITSCSLDAADENPLLKQRLCALTSATLLDTAGTSGGNTAPLSEETLAPREHISAAHVCLSGFRFSQTANNFSFFAFNLPNVEKNGPKSSRLSVPNETFPSGFCLRNTFSK